MGRKIKTDIAALHLASKLDLELIGDKNALVKQVDSIDLAANGTLCFAKNSNWARKASDTAILITSLTDAINRKGTTLVSSQPRLDFARALSFLEKFSGFEWAGEEPFVDVSARIGRNVVLGKGVRVGANTIIHHNVVIGDEVIIGQRCVIKSGAIIGENGFGFERDSQGNAVRLPHLGTVIIDDDVEIGSLTTVCRGTLGNTRLRKGSKIDDHVHIAHNVDVGEDAFIIACAEVSGGVRIGARAWLAPNSSVINQVNIGADAVIGLGSVVLKSVPNGAVVVGNPAKPLVK